MKIIHAARRGGKTSFMIRLLRENPNAIGIVSSKQRKSEILTKYQDSIPTLADQLFTPGEIILGRHDGRPANTVAAVDDIGDVLQMFVGSIPIEFATTSSDVTELNPQIITRMFETSGGQKYAASPMRDLDVIGTTHGKATVETILPVIDPKARE